MARAVKQSHHGRIPGYNTVYIDRGLFGKKLIAHVHEQIMHLGVANTMAHIQTEWWIPKPRAKVNYGNRIEWIPIWSVIVQVINKTGRP